MSAIRLRPIETLQDAKIEKLETAAELFAQGLGDGRSGIAAHE
jgi:hypothetical protein